MKLLLSILLVFTTFFSIGQRCSCKAMLPIALQPRGNEKNIKSNHPILHDSIIQIGEIYRWQNAYAKTTSTITWKPLSKKSIRKLNTPEDTLYTLKGYLWFVHLIKFDCDLHIEIGDKDSAAKRIIVEVPYGNTAVQNKITHYLDSLGLPLLGCTERDFNKAHFKHGIPVLVKGYGFYDAYHKENKSHGDQHTSKYLWELHPVTDIEFLVE